MPNLVWFRTDLRIHDNPALYHACANSDEGVIAIFLVAGQQWQGHDWGPSKIDFVLRHVAALSEALARHRIPLLVFPADTFADAPKVLLRVAAQHHCTALYYNRDYEWNERQRDQQVVSAMQAHGIRVQVFDDQTCLPPDDPDLHTNAGKPYVVFTPFKKRWLATLQARGIPNLLPTPPIQPSLPVGSSPIPTVAEIRQTTPHCRDLWPAGEGEAQARLERFLAGPIHTYDQQRDRPSVDGTSTLSPYLACGVISSRACLLGAIAANDHELVAAKNGPGVWLSELVWREFYRHVMVHFPRVCKYQPFKLETESVPWQQDEAAFERWATGMTGFPIVDAGMRQLNQTGWMHNRLRMITAMFLTKDLLIDWRWGERYFMEHLVDGDLASNNGGWQWSASTGTDAVPYFRIFNPYSQSRKFDPQGQFIRRYCPELSALDNKKIHEPATVGPLLFASLNYPEVMVDHNEARQRILAAFKKPD